MSGPVLVTGGAGSLGRRVVDALLKIGREVRVFDLPSVDYSGLEDAPRIEIVRGDITDAGSVDQATAGVGAVIHLAALLPPAAENDRARTFSINVDATLCLVEAAVRNAAAASFVFSSSVSTYGDTSEEDAPTVPGHSQEALDCYAASKIAAEKAVRQVCPHAAVLRISGVAVPGFYQPPAIWPFMAEQKIEFVHRDDVAAALCAAAESSEARGGDFIVAGGASWQVRGVQYVSDYYDLLGVPIEEARFLERPGYFHFYDTSASQAALQYQRTTYPQYLEQISAELRLMMEQ